MLEILMRAMWRGDFDPSHLFDNDEYDPVLHEDPESRLCVLIDAPPATLTDGQLKLKPRACEYFEAGRETILSVMYCMALLPGAASAWGGMLESGDGRKAENSRTRQ